MISTKILTKKDLFKILEERYKDYEDGFGVAVVTTITTRGDDAPFQQSVTFVESLIPKEEIV